MGPALRFDTAHPHAQEADTHHEAASPVELHTTAAHLFPRCKPKPLAAAEDPRPLTQNHHARLLSAARGQNTSQPPSGHACCNAHAPSVHTSLIAHAGCRFLGTSRRDSSHLATARRLRRMLAARPPPSAPLELRRPRGRQGAQNPLKTFCRLSLYLAHSPASLSSSS